MSGAVFLFAMSREPVNSMNFSISTLTVGDFHEVDGLMKKNSSTLGFLPKNPLLEHLKGGWAIGATSEDGSLAAYLLYARYPERIRVIHLCVSANFRGSGLARRLVEELIAQCDTQAVIRLRCRRDFDADKLWPRLGFVPVGEKVGRSLEGHTLTHWELRLKNDSQLDLFKEGISDQLLDVAIDAQVLFHFNQPMSSVTAASKALAADFMIDAIRIRVAPEIFHEINRQDDPDKRKRSQALANSFSRISYDSRQAEQVESDLKTVLPFSKRSALSDIRHLAQTSASEVEVFVTNDQRILKRAKEVEAITKLQIYSPDELVVRIHQGDDAEAYRDSPISGQSVFWRRARSEDLRQLPKLLKRPKEKLGKLREVLQKLNSDPHSMSLSLLWRGDELLGARATQAGSRSVDITFLRAAPSRHQKLIEEFMVWDSVVSRQAENVRTVKLSKSQWSNYTRADLLKMGFLETDYDFRRLTLASVLTCEEVKSELNKQFSSDMEALGAIGDDELTKMCSPIVLRDRDEPAYIVPIRPEYALSLFDRKQASTDLFGGHQQVLMRCDNVYFRKKSHHHMLKAPARILWYESREVGAITACSHLDAVTIGTPKDLFRSFKELGALDWSDIYEMCKRDVTAEIMALQFSHTFEFPHSVSLHMLKRLAGSGFGSIQSPRSIEMPLFINVAEFGFTGAEN